MGSTCPSCNADINDSTEFCPKCQANIRALRAESNIKMFKNAAEGWQKTAIEHEETIEELRKVISKFVEAGFNRDITLGDPIRLIEVQRELREAVGHGRKALETVVTQINNRLVEEENKVLEKAVDELDPDRAIKHLEEITED